MVKNAPHGNPIRKPRRAFFQASGPDISMILRRPWRP